MSSLTPSHRAAAEEQASLWAAKIDGSSLSAADRVELDAWLASDSEHRALLSQYCQFSADLEEQLPHLVAAGGIAIPEEKKTPSGWGKSLKWILGGVCALACAVLVGRLWIRPNAGPQKFATPVAQRQSVTLPDGTRVELNARTTLLVENGPAERRVRLAEGEAFFVVSKDKARPFIVETPAGSVRVTGTIFDVKSEVVSELEVTVVEGSVQVRPSDSSGAQAIAPVALGAGDRLSARLSGVAVTALSRNEVDDALAWREGTLVLVGTPLGEALARFAHYQGRGITVTASVENLRVGGRHSLDDLDGFLGYISEGFPSVRVTRDLSGNVRVSLRTEP
jgi:transmembrane sensor